MTKTSLTITGGEVAIAAAHADGVRAYKGIPFAAPPVGDLRWRAPHPVHPWKGVRPADKFGWNAMQGMVFDDIDPTKPGISEDCLYLNVWTAAAPGDAAKLPVFFWIHGGGHVVGSGAEPRYDGSRLAARGVIVITVNLRLGVFGFLAHRELTAEQGFSGNQGLLDLVAALEWTRDNIAAFGGDPASVTIAGESAGSEAVSALMASPLAKGLFIRAIGQSAAMFTSPSRGPARLTTAEALGADLAARLAAKSLAELRAAPADTILAVAPPFVFRPIIDGHFLPRTPAEIFAAGEQNDVPLLAGWCKDEGFNFTLLSGAKGERSYVEQARALFGADADACLKLYPAGTPELDAASARELGGDLTIIHNTWAWIEAQKKTGRAELRRFRFERCPLTPQGWFGDRDSKTAGAFHAGDILYVFDNLDAFPWLIDDADRALAKAASSYWVNFVKTGDPNGHGLPNWPSFREPNAPILALDAPPRLMNEPDRARQEFLADVVRRHAK